MTSTIDTDFMAAIIADPADDCPRLIYADFLEERGETLRAEYIRVGIAVAKWEQKLEIPIGFQRAGYLMAHCIERKTLVDGACDCLGCMNSRMNEILLSSPICPRAKHVYPFHSLFRNSGENGYSVFSDRRGFPYLVSCTLAEWLEHGPLIVRHQPIEVVRLRDRDSTYRSGYSSWSTIGWWNVGHYPGGRQLSNQEYIEDLPEPIWSLLEGRKNSCNRGWTQYDVVDEANADLSQACLKWAKATPFSKAKVQS